MSASSVNRSRSTSIPLEGYQSIDKRSMREAAPGNPRVGSGNAAAVKAGGIRLRDKFLNFVTTHGKRADPKIREGRIQAHAHVGKLLEAVAWKDQSGPGNEGRADHAATKKQVINCTKELNSAMEPMTSRGRKQSDEFQASLDVHLKYLSINQLVAIHKGLTEPTKPLFADGSPRFEIMIRSVRAALAKTNQMVSHPEFLPAARQHFDEARDAVIAQFSDKGVGTPIEDPVAFADAMTSAAKALKSYRRVCPKMEKSVQTKTAQLQRLLALTPVNLSGLTLLQLKALKSSLRVIGAKEADEKVAAEIEKRVVSNMAAEEGSETTKAVAAMFNADNAGTPESAQKLFDKAMEQAGAGLAKEGATPSESLKRAVVLTMLGQQLESGTIGEAQVTPLLNNLPTKQLIAVAEAEPGAGGLQEIAQNCLAQRQDSTRAVALAAITQAMTLVSKDAAGKSTVADPHAFAHALVQAEKANQTFQECEPPPDEAVDQQIHALGMALQEMFDLRADGNPNGGPKTPAFNAETWTDSDLASFAAALTGFQNAVADPAGAVGIRGAATAIKAELDSRAAPLKADYKAAVQRVLALLDVPDQEPAEAQLALISARAELATMKNLEARLLTLNGAENPESIELVRKSLIKDALFSATHAQLRALLPKAAQLGQPQPGSAAGTYELKLLIGEAKANLTESDLLVGIRREAGDALKQPANQLSAAPGKLMPRAIEARFESALQVASARLQSAGAEVTEQRKYELVLGLIGENHLPKLFDNIAPERLLAIARPSDPSGASNVQLIARASLAKRQATTRTAFFNLLEKAATASTQQFAEVVSLAHEQSALCLRYSTPQQLVDDKLVESRGRLRDEIEGRIMNGGLPLGDLTDTDLLRIRSVLQSLGDSAAALTEIDSRIRVIEGEQTQDIGIAIAALLGDPPNYVGMLKALRTSNHRLDNLFANQTADGDGVNRGAVETPGLRQALINVAIQTMTEDDREILADALCDEDFMILKAAMQDSLGPLANHGSLMRTMQRTLGDLDALRTALLTQNVEMPESEMSYGLEDASINPPAIHRLANGFGVNIIPGNAVQIVVSQGEATEGMMAVLQPRLAGLSQSTTPARFQSALAGAFGDLMRSEHSPFRMEHGAVQAPDRAVTTTESISDDGRKLSVVCDIEPGTLFRPIGPEAKPTSAFWLRGGAQATFEFALLADGTRALTGMRFGFDPALSAWKMPYRMPTKMAHVLEVPQASNDFGAYVERGAGAPAREAFFFISRLHSMEHEPGKLNLHNLFALSLSLADVKKEWPSDFDAAQLALDAFQMRGPDQPPTRDELLAVFQPLKDKVTQALEPSVSLFVRQTVSGIPAPERNSRRPFRATTGS